MNQTAVSQLGPELEQRIKGTILRASWAMVPVSTIIALLVGNNPILAGTVGAAFALIGWQGFKQDNDLSKSLLAIGFVGQAMALTAALAGHAWQTDSHMLFFALLACCVALNEVKALLAAAAVIIVHHLSLSMLLPALVYPPDAFWLNVVRTLGHGAIVALEVAALTTVVRIRHELSAEAAEKAAILAESNAAAEAARKSSEAVVDRLRGALSNLSQGRLNEQLDEAFPAQYESLRRDYNAAIGNLAEMIEGVADATVNILAGSHEISSAATDLAARTEKQAATLEEIARSIHRLADLVGQTLKTAKDATGASGQTKESVQSSEAVVGKAAVSISKIEASSVEIGQRTGMIDEIAFQTNLLALNAGVEAAKAGEAGRGFVLVASEVRTLAQRSSVAAQEIRELIETSTYEVQDGVIHVKETVKALQTVTDAVSESSERVDVIAASAQNQDTAVREINAAVSDLDRVTQQNAAMFEQTSSACRLLTESAEVLQKMTER
ncbi:MAG: methyl-accepting chemotaxis protein, partial [Pseudomonadota bacterium]